MFDILPFLGTIAAIALLFRYPITVVDICLFGVFWALTSFALSIGYHRLFTHRSFETSKTVRTLLAVFGCMAARSSVISWSAIHRRHHNLADHHGDVHSPNLHGLSLFGRIRGWIHAQIVWMWEHEYPNAVHYTPDLLRDKHLMQIDRFYYLWVSLGFVVPAVVGGLVTMSWIGALTGFLWGGVVRQFVVAQQTSLVNSLGHLVGSRPFKMRDNDSRNNAILSIFTWGEGWHNNHHAFPESANFGFRWYQFDHGYFTLCVMEKLGLVWNVRRPKTDLVEKREREYRSRWERDGSSRFMPSEDSAKAMREADRRAQRKLRRERQAPGSTEPAPDA